MSKETLNAETFYNNSNEFVSSSKYPIEKRKFTYYDLIKLSEQYAEAYHKAKVNAITYEEIFKESENIMFQFSKEDVTEDDKYRFKQGAKWFKNRLLNG